MVSTGVRKRSYRTSIAIIRLGVRKTDRIANEVQEELLKASSKLLEYLKSQKVDRLTTNAVNHFPSFDYRSNPRTVTGYTVSSTLPFEVPVDRAGIILNVSVNNGAITVSSFSFRDSGEVSSHDRLYSIRDAVVRARIDARTAVLSLVNMLGNPVYVKITDSCTSRPVYAPNIAERLTNTVLVQCLISLSNRN